MVTSWTNGGVGLGLRYRRIKRPIQVTKHNYKVFNKYNITLVFSVLALLFCLSGRIFASTKYWPPQQNTSANTENTG